MQLSQTRHHRIGESRTFLFTFLLFMPPPPKPGRKRPSKIHHCVAVFVVFDQSDEVVNEDPRITSRLTRSGFNRCVRLKAATTIQ